MAGRAVAPEQRTAPAPVSTPPARRTRTAGSPTPPGNQAAQPPVVLTPVDLGGTGEFVPAPEVAAAITAARGRGLAVPVRLGPLAHGDLRVRASGESWETTGGLQALTLEHPALSPARAAG